MSKIQKLDNLNISTLLWILFASLSIGDVILNLKYMILTPINSGFGIFFNRFISNYPISNISCILLFAALVIFAVALSKKNFKLISFSSISIFIIEALVSIERLIYLFNDFSYLSNPTYILTYIVGILEHICLSLYFLFVFIDRNKIFDKKSSLIKSRAFAIIGIFCTCLSSMVALENNESLYVWILEFLPPLIPYVFLILFTIPKFRLTANEYGASFIQVVAIIVVIALIYFGVCAFSNHQIINADTTYYVDDNNNGRADYGEAVYSEDKNGNTTFYY